MPLISTYGSSSSRSFGLNAFLKSILGGTLFSDSTYYYRAFLSNGELEIDGFTTVNLDVLVIGGGGPGRQTAGGAGGIVYAGNKTFSRGKYPVVIGQGGTPATEAPGGNSTIADIIALGGGIGGLTDNTVGGNGGSGGGAGRDGISNNTPGTGLQPSASNLGGGIGYGSRGGFASGTGWGGGGGGGGAGGVGGNGQGNANQANEVAGNAGAGLNTWSSWATATGTGENGFYASGGATSAVGNTINHGLRSLGGGGSHNTTAMANTGGGGGSSGNGGSGLIIVRYPKSLV
jgi:hypothetical protein